jgi:hypothetical protein
MTVFRNSLIDLVEFTMTIPLKRQNYWTGTATGGAAGTLIDTLRWEKDDFFNNLSPSAQVKILTTTDGAVPQGQLRYITDWVQSTGTASIHANWTTANVGAGDTYAIFSEYSWSEVVAAINAAINAVAISHPLRAIDETITLQSSTYEYVIPDNFVAINRISMEDGNGDYPEQIDPAHWRIVFQDVPKIHLLRAPTSEIFEGHELTNLFADSDLTDDRHLRIEGYKRQPVLVNDQDLCYLNPNYVGYQAAALLHAARMGRSDTDPGDHKTQFTLCQQLAGSFLPKMDWAINTKKVY